jgi:hypothetical protein
MLKIISRNISVFVICLTLIGCTATRDLSKLNRDPQCLYVSDIVSANRSNNSQEVYVPTFSFDEREFVQVYNKLGQPLGYRDIYGTELTTADIASIGPYVNEVNKLSLQTVTWPVKRNQYLQFPELFPKAKTPYKAMPRPAFCDQPLR